MPLNLRDVARVLEDGLSGYAEITYGSTYRRSVDPNVLLAHPAIRSLHSRQGDADKASLRILDLACGSGKQLIGAAAANRKFWFHGIDGTPAHVAQAISYAKISSLDNAFFECADLLNWTGLQANFGTYDIVTCLGTFAWTPIDVQHSILSIVANCLSADGIAAVHVLTKPGALTTIATQKSLKASATDCSALRARLKLATAYSAEHAPIVEDSGAMHGIGIDAEIKSISQRTDAGVAHEYLGGAVSAYYFRELVEMTAKHGLYIVGDATYGVAHPASPPDGIPGHLYASATSWDEQQEVLDCFGRSRGGRCLVLSKRPRVETDTAPSFSGLHIRLHKRYEISDLMRYVRHGLDQERDLADLTATLEQLRACYPATTQVNRMPAGGESVRNKWLLDLLASGRIECCVEPLLFASWAANTPRTSALALSELRDGSDQLTSRTGKQIESCQLFREVLNLADGAHCIADLDRHCSDWNLFSNDPTSRTSLSKMLAKTGHDSTTTLIDELVRSLPRRLYELGYFD